MKVMTTATKITLLRVLMLPAYMVFMYLSGGQSNLWMWVSLGIFILASLTDFVDGYIARKYNQVSDFGKFMDPLADKLLVIGTMLCVVYKFDAIRPYFFWAVLLVIFREITVTGLRAIAASAPSGEVIAANMLGKIKTVTQMACILLVLLEPAAQYFIESALGGAENYALHNVFPLSIVTTVLMAVFTLWSGIAYLYQYRRFLKG